MSLNSYLSKYSFYPKQIHILPETDLGVVVVIPCYNEPSLIDALEALWKCDRPICSVEVIVVVNSSENDPEAVLLQNAKTVAQTNKWISNNDDCRFRIYILEAGNLPEKHAGVGLARKIGMDEAVGRFEKVNNKRGVIACFDADCICLSNYLNAIENHFLDNPKTPGCSISFEHPVTGKEDSLIYDGIVDYELFLRYYNQGLRFSGFPFAYHTVGSSMAVTSEVYQKQGGMNKRKAGEDFYFLQKIIPLGNYSELNETLVIPSPRPSSRVPFGTGIAIQKWLDKKELLTYHPQVFDDLKIFFKQIPQFYSSKNIESPIKDFSAALNEFLISKNFKDKIIEMKENSSSLPFFKKRFFQWFNGFMILKFVHFARDNYYQQIEIGEAAALMLEKIEYQSYVESMSQKELLITYRKIEKNVFLHNML